MQNLYNQLSVVIPADPLRQRLRGEKRGPISGPLHLNNPVVLA